MNSSTTEPLPWPAPYAQGDANPWIATLLLRLPIALALIDSDGRVVATNEALHATCGDDCRPGSRAENIVVEADRERVAAAMARAIRREGPFEVRATLSVRPDEEQVLTLSPVPPGLGIAAVLLMRDIREQLRVEKQVAAITRMQAVGQLAGGIAHDFNNILTAVLALTDQLLARHAVGDVDHDDLAQISANARRAAALVAQLLAFARQQPQRQQVLDLEVSVAGLRPLLEQLSGTGINVVVDAPGLKRAVFADASQIEQVIVNLAVNARDAMGGSGTLTVRLRDIDAADVARLGHKIMPHADHVAIEVADTGGGIPPEIAGRVFEPFFTTKPMGQGTGLGLSTVYGIVKQSGGFIFTRPGRNGGAVFSVYLPAVPREGLSTAVAPPAVVHVGPMTARVLLVEDEAGVRAVLERGLRRQGIAVEAVDGAAAALDWLAIPPGFDVLVSDIMMPGIDGVELAARAMALHPALGVVLISGFAEPPLHRAAGRQGVHFLAKPFALGDLVAAIAAARTPA